MTDAVKEQLSACLDGELPKAELDLLVQRVARNGELCEAMRHYALVSEALRHQRPAVAPQAFAQNVMAALEREPPLKSAVRMSPALMRRLRPVAGMAIAAGVAAIAVLSVQQIGSMPQTQTQQMASNDTSGQQTAAEAVRNSMAADAPVIASLNDDDYPGYAQDGQPPARLRDSYTVPDPGSTSMSVFVPATRLTNYVVAHSEYSSPLGRRSVLTGVLADDDDDPRIPDAAAADAPAQER